MSKTQLWIGNPVCQRVDAFVKWPYMASVVANLPVTHLTVMFYLFKSSFRLKQEILPVRTLHLFTCIKIQVLLYLRHTFFF